MSAMFDFLWTKWDKKLSELERSVNPAAPEETPRPVGHVVKNRGGDTEARYLSDIIRQNVNEIKELNLKLARQAVDIEHLQIELEAAGQIVRQKGAAMIDHVEFTLHRVDHNLVQFRVVIERVAVQPVFTHGPPGLIELRRPG